MVDLSILIFTSIPLILMIAGIMLANNICDIEDDILNKRFTLPFYIGKNKALVLFALLYVISFVVIVVGVLLKFLPVINLLVFIAAFPIAQNLKVFMKEQNKATTFVVSVKNFIVFSAIWIVSFVLNSAIDIFIA
jgi:1,4-dihydroxy-2-naphthoate octaprenyltransferase